MKKKSFLTVNDRLYWKAYGEGQLDEEHGFEAGKREGYRKGIEDAAKIVLSAPGNTYTMDCDHEDLAREIRALLEGGK